VKIPVWSPKNESLTWAIASSISRNLNATTSGANASFEQTAAVTGTSVRIVGGKNVPVGLAAQEALPPARERLVDPALGPRRRVLVDHRPPRSVWLSRGSPSFRPFPPPSMNFAMNASQISS
jgi:hypothetical protein